MPAAATTVSPRSASALLPRLKSISHDWCALPALELPVQACPQGKGSWKLVARMLISLLGAGSAALLAGTGSPGAVAPATGDRRRHGTGRRCRDGAAGQTE